LVLVTTTPEPAPVRLLVVDDEADVEALLRLRFRREIRDGRYDFIFSTDPLKALEVVEEVDDLDLVLIDLNMPKMHGLELLDRLTDLERPFRSIVVTAYGDMGNIRAAMMGGAFDFQVKPIDIDDLRNTIAKGASVVQALRAGEMADRRAAELAERNRFVEEVFGRYVSEDVKHYLLASPSGYGASELRQLTVMMADIRGFTRLTEELAPVDVVNLLNDYLTVAAEIVLRHNGTINEIIGDGLLVFFGVPVSDDKAAEHAAAAALELQLEVAALNRRSRERGFPPLGIGIGIHSGDAVVGTIGSDHCQKYTAIGKHVNLAARIEGQTVAGQVLISDVTRHQLGELVETAGSRDLRAKGLSTPVVIHDLTGIGPPYDLHLPTRDLTMRSIEPPVPITLATIEDKGLNAVESGDLVAAGREVAMLRTAARADPMTDVVMYVDGTELYAKVIGVAAGDTTSDLTVAFTTLPDEARTMLLSLGSGGDVAVEPLSANAEGT
jgi:adenylate cyclase